MKSLLLLLMAFVLAVFSACPKNSGQPADTANAAKTGALPKPQVAAPAAPPVAAAPAPPGAPNSRLELDGLYIGMDTASVRKQIPADWKGEPTWVKGSNDTTGYLTSSAPSTPPDKGVISPPAVVTYFFLEGKLVAALHVKPGTSQADYDRWVAESTAKYGPSGAATPDFAKNCEFLAQLKFPPPDGKTVVWNNAELLQVLALQYSPSMGMAQYMLVDVQAYSKVQQAIMAQPGNSTPPPAPAG